jgi:hypothetical protein
VQKDVLIIADELSCQNLLDHRSDLERFIKNIINYSLKPCYYCYSIAIIAGFKRMSDDKKLRLLDEVLYFEENDWVSYRENSLLENAVLQVQGSFQVHKEMAIMVALGSMSVACQGSVEVEQPYGGRINTALYTLTIAESGERKTTVSNQLTEGIERIKNELNALFESDQSKHNNDYYLWTLTLKTLESKLKAAIKNDEQVKHAEDQIRDHLLAKPKPPVNPKFLYKDATPSALLRSMYESQKHACVIMDEANKIFSSNLTGDLGLLNSLWDSGSVVVDRISKDSFEFSDGSLTLSLMTQMAVIDSFLNKRGEAARGSGFLARLLVVRPRRKAGEHEIKSYGDLDKIKAFNDRLYNLIKQRINGSDQQKLRLSYTETAKVRWQEEFKRIQVEMKAGGLYEFHQDHAAKLMDNVSRVAAIVHYFNPETGQETNKHIKDETLDYAIALCHRFSKHYLYYMTGKPKVIEDAELLVEFCLKNDTEKFLKKDITNNLYCNFLFYDHCTNEEALSTLNTSYRNPKIFAFTLTNVLQYGPNQLRKNDHNYSAFRNAVSLLERMDIIKTFEYNKKDYYCFNEATHLNGHLSYNNHINDNGDNCYISDKFNSEEINKLPVPKFKNGHLYFLSNLPLFDNLIPIKLYNRYRNKGIPYKYTIFYLIKSET